MEIPGIFNADLNPLDSSLHGKDGVNRIQQVY